MHNDYLPSSLRNFNSILPAYARFAFAASLFTARDIHALTCQLHINKDNYIEKKSIATDSKSGYERINQLSV